MKQLLLLAGLLTSLQQLHAQDGMLDPTFGNNGHVMLDTTYQSAAFQSGGKLLGLLPFSDGFRLTRYDQDGNLDISFGAGGSVIMNIPGFSFTVYAFVKVFNNDDIIVAVQGGGVPHLQDPTPTNEIFFGLVKLKSTGELDLAFGDNGVAIEKVQLASSGSYLGTYKTPPRLFSLIVTEDLKILTTLENQENRYEFRFFTKRYQANGTPDDSFTPFSFSYVHGFLVDQAARNGVIIAAGYEDDQDPPAKDRIVIDINTVPVTRFRYGPYRDVQLSEDYIKVPKERPTAIAVQQDGKFLVSSTSGKLLRFNADQTLDNSFGNYVEQNKTAGYTTPNGFQYTFGEKGGVIVPFQVYKIFVQSDNKILVASGAAEVARYNADGTIDNTFGTNGITYANVPGLYDTKAIKLASSRIYIYSTRYRPDLPGGPDVITAFTINSSCTCPTFLNTLPIVGPATCGNNNGQISIIPQSGTAPYQYSIDGGTTYTSGPNVGYTFFYLAPGTYQLRLKDANGCESEVVQRTVGISYCPPTTCTPPTFLNTLPIVGNATCGNNDGQISIIPTRGTGPYMYSFDGGATYVSGPNVGLTRFNLAAGSYQLRLKDASGCESVVITRELRTESCLTCTPPTFLNTRPVVGDATCNQSDGQISIIPSSGTGPFMYSINGGSTYVAGPNAGYTFFNLPAGNYQLRLKAGNGCESYVVERTVQSINCPSTTPTITGANKGFVSDENNINSKLKVSAYPNPSSGKFTLQVLQSNTSKAEVFIYDGKGTLVQQAIINPGKGSTIHVNLSGKAKGMYYVKVVTQQGTSTSKILVH